MQWAEQIYCMVCAGMCVYICVCVCVFSGTRKWHFLKHKLRFLNGCHICNCSLANSISYIYNICTWIWNNVWKSTITNMTTVKTFRLLNHNFFFTSCFVCVCMREGRKATECTHKRHYPETHTYVHFHNMMEYITLCLDSTNEVEQWYVRHNYCIMS